EKTYKFLDDFIGEMAKLFPDQYFHIGGDEVNGKEWDANPKIQEYKRTHNLKIKRGTSGLFQPARPENRGKACKNSGWLGQDLRSRCSQRHHDPPLARSAISGGGSAAGLPRNPF